MKSILVMGGNGFIGKGVLEFMRNFPQLKLHCLSRHDPSVKIEGVEFIKADAA
jgi:nucleoside-diphosphate-sugar epimerase